MRRPTTAPATISAADLLAKSLPEPRCVVPGVVVEGTSGLVGRPKIGKSWLQAGMALAVAGGGRALGLPVEPGEALYLALEDTERRLQARLAVLLQGSPAPEGLTLATSWPRLDAGGLEALEAWLTDHSAGRFVAIDTLAKVRPRRRRDADLYAEDYGAVEGLKTLADRFRVAIVVSHHLRKLGAEDPIDTVSGTLGLTGALDAVLILQRARGRHDATLFVTGRDLEERELALKWSPEFGVWSVLGDADDFRRSEERLQIVDLLVTEGPLKAKAISSALNRKENTTRWLLSQMVKAGEVVAGPRGYAVLTPTPHTLSNGLLLHTAPTSPTGPTVQAMPVQKRWGVGGVGGA